MGYKVKPTSEQPFVMTKKEHKAAIKHQAKKVERNSKSQRPFVDKSVTTLKSDNSGLHLYCSKKESFLGKDPQTGKFKIKLGLGWNEHHPKNTSTHRVDYLPFFKNHDVPSKGLLKIGNGETGHVSQH